MNRFTYICGEIRKTYKLLTNDIYEKANQSDIMGGYVRAILEKNIPKCLCMCLNPILFTDSTYLVKFCHNIPANSFSLLFNIDKLVSNIDVLSRKGQFQLPGLKSFL